MNGPQLDQTIVSMAIGGPYLWPRHERLIAAGRELGKRMAAVRRRRLPQLHLAPDVAVEVLAVPAEQVDLGSDYVAARTSCPAIPGLAPSPGVSAVTRCISSL